MVHEYRYILMNLEMSGNVYDEPSEYSLALTGNVGVIL